MTATAWGRRQPANSTKQAKLIPVDANLGTERTNLRHTVQEPDTFEATDSSLVPRSCGENGTT